MTKHVVVVGDALLDVDVETSVERLVPDSVAPVLDEMSRVQRPGGAALAARFAASDPGVEVTLVAAVPNDPAGQALRAALDPALHLVSLPSHGATGVKTRFRRGRQTVARLDQGGAGLQVDGIPGSVAELLHSADAVLVSDYGRGVTRAPGMSELLMTVASHRPVLWDPHPRGAQPVARTRLVTPNAAEAAASCGEPKARTVADGCRQARRLVERWQVGGVAVTLGGRGAVLATTAESAALFPTLQSIDEDPCGAGDRFASRAATALAAGALPAEAVSAGVAGATAFLARGGLARLDQPLEEPAGPGPVADLIRSVRARGGTVVATGGCFDLLHAGHVATLNAARAMGDCLIVCLNSDDSVRRMKGPDRPVQPVEDRRRVLEGLRAVDAVVVFDEDTPRQALAALRPDVWVKGGDYEGTELPESSLVRSWGGEVVTVPFVPGLSTTNLLTRVRV
jgi:rfaE bifunctional protein nucleotidyltransferase chain/domain/rfaE bifunctional protein kinase chain/domain